LLAAHIAQIVNLFESRRVCGGTAVAPAECVGQVLPWRPRHEVPRRPSKPESPSSFLPVGAYAGRARFRPTARASLTPALESAIGRIVEVGYAGIAPPGEMFAGQALYLEWRSDEVLDGYLIPEQDLEFL
jgi:hypothetical protein